MVILEGLSWNVECRGWLVLEVSQQAVLGNLTGEKFLQQMPSVLAYLLLGHEDRKKRPTLTSRSSRWTLRIHVG